MKIKVPEFNNAEDLKWWVKDQKNPKLTKRFNSNHDYYSGGMSWKRCLEDESYHECMCNAFKGEITL